MIKIVLEFIGTPQEVMFVISALYFDNHCDLALLGLIFPGFSITCGVRQGCPLSPLIFVVVVDMLLRLLVMRIPDCYPRAFADDTAAAITSFSFQNIPIWNLFRGFAAVSNLSMPKAVIIPFWPVDLRVFSASLVRTPWADVSVCSSARYLGFWEGPGKGTTS